MIRILLFLFCLMPFTLLAQLTIPEHGGVWVHDEAGVLSANTKAELEYLLKAERDSTTNQIAILIIPTLGDEAEEDYTLKVAEKWKIGRKDHDNGVLFFIAVKDRKMRLEVGEGLEGVLTDAVSSRINRNQVTPHFRVNDYDGGVKAGVAAIFQAIRGEYVNTDPLPVAGKRRSRSPWLSLIVILVIIIASSRRRGGGGGGGGGYLAAGALLGGLGRGGSYGGGGGGGDYGGGGSFGGGGSSDSW